VFCKKISFRILIVIPTIIVLGFTSSCSDNRTIPPQSFDAIVFGTVKNTLNKPIEYISVGATAKETACGDTTNAISISGAVGHTKTEGNYVIRLKGFTSKALNCLTVQFKDFENSEYKDTLIAKNVSFELSSEPPFDSTRVDVVLEKSK